MTEGRSPESPLPWCLRGQGVQRLGRVTRELRVDNSSAATHRLGAGSERGFNPDFLSVCAPYGLTPKTIGIRCPNENGDVESGTLQLITMPNAPTPSWALSAQDSVPPQGQINPRQAI